MPTPPQNPVSAIDAFSGLLGGLAARGEIVQAIPKYQRLRDPAAVQKCRERGQCEWPDCRSKASEKWMDPHHIETRGSGGPDTDENLIALCRYHHNLAHTGKLPKKILALIAAERDAK